MGGRKMLIDWLTLRYPLNNELGQNLVARIRDCLGFVVSVNSEGVEQWRKNTLDLDKLRSDSDGLFWSLTGDADGRLHLSVTCCGWSSSSARAGSGAWREIGKVCNLRICVSFIKHFLRR